MIAVAFPAKGSSTTCYWTCMGLCIIAGKRQHDCDAACTGSVLYHYYTTGRTYVRTR